MIILTVLGIRKVNFIDETLTEITDINSVKQRYAINFRGSVHDRAIAIRDVALAKTPSQLNKYVGEIESLEQFYRTSEQDMEKMMASDAHFTSEEKSILSRISSIQNSTLPLILNIIQASRDGDKSLAQDLLLDKARPAFMDWLDAINEFIDYQENANRTATPLARNVAGDFSSLMMTLSLIAIFIGIVVAKLIEVSLHRSLGGEPFDAATALSSIAQGDLTTKVKTTYPDSMLASLCSMRNKLSTTVSSIMGASHELSEQTMNVVNGSKNAYDAAQSQLELTTQTKERLGDMRSGLANISDIATLTEKNSQETTTFAKEGKEKINESATEMERISCTVNETVSQVLRLEETTKEIGSIVNVITGISEQTNLLALNAAIEAARAGESGRGFAVVADEVRQLAQRTGEATNQIENMIAEVQKETSASVMSMEKTQPIVEHGLSLTKATTDLLQKIEQQATDSLANVQKVASATGEQVYSIEEIANTMEQINNMSAESTSSLQTNNEATKSLYQLSNNLKENVSYFTVDSSS